MSESIKTLEEKIAFLEHHVTEQDKAMLEMAEEIAALRRQFQALKNQLSSRAEDAGAAERQDFDERPPHY